MYRKVRIINTKAARKSMYYCDWKMERYKVIDKSRVSNNDCW